MATAAPLFPLNTVLFPDGPLPLRIFETRYVDMVRECMRSQKPFGVVLVRSGSEVGVSGAAATSEIGTTARIVDFATLPDGLLGIRCLGEHRFRVARHWQQSDGLHRADIELLDPPAAAGVPEKLQHLAGLLRKLMAELKELYRGVPERFEDASWVGFRLAEILPLGLAEKQACLEESDPLACLARLDSLIRKVAP